MVPISNKKEKQSQPHHQRGLTAVSIHVILGHPSHTPSEGPARLGTHKHVINSIFFRVIAHLLCARHTYECTKILDLWNLRVSRGSGGRQTEKNLINYIVCEMAIRT